MLKIILARLHQGHRTIKYPYGPAPAMPERYRGRPTCDRAKCKSCGECAGVCPTDAVENGQIDLGRCLFCGECEKACTNGAIQFTKDFQLAARERADLVLKNNEQQLAAALDKKMQRIFGRSLKLREVSAGGCNACEADTNVLGTPGFDLGRFGIQFVASPRHADGLLITGPVPENMRLALQKTYAAVPDPKIVIAVGACAISGGPFTGHQQVHNGADSLIPVDLYIPGCPPHPLTILNGLLRLLGRI